MSQLDSFQYRIENLSLAFQGGVRRGVLVFTGICLVLLAPFYFGGQAAAGLYKNTWFDSENAVIPKKLAENEYEVSETQIVPLASGESALYISVSNKLNTGVGYFPWVYTLQVTSKDGTLLDQQKFSSYLLPEEVKYLTLNSADPTAANLKIIEEPETQKVFYNPNANNNQKTPDIQIRNDQVLPGTDPNSLKISAIFKNNTEFNIEKVDVLFLIRDSRQSVVGIGVYNFSGFVARSERIIQLDYPKPRDREARFLDLRWSVNYLDKNTIVLK
jgi:hypothetical protein